MKYIYVITDMRNAPRHVRFVCADCGGVSEHLSQYFRRSRVATDMRNDFESACRLFVDLLNQGKLDDLFFKKTTIDGCRSACCQCERPKNLKGLHVCRSLSLKSQEKITRGVSK